MHAWACTKGMKSINCHIIEHNWSENREKAVLSEEHNELDGTWLQVYYQNNTGHTWYNHCNSRPSLKTVLDGKKIIYNGPTEFIIKCKNTQFGPNFTPNTTLLDTTVFRL